MIMVGDSSAKNHIAKRIEELDFTNKSILSRIAELEELTSSQALNELEFDALCQMLAVFKNGVADMTTEQKRAALRTIVRKVIWDGTNAHVILFGATDGEIEYPDISSRLNLVQDDDTDDDSELPYEDMEYEGDNGLGKTQPPNDSNVRWGAYSIFHAPGSIGCQPGTLGGVEGGNAFDQSDGSNGDQVLLVGRLGVVFLHNMGHQPEISFNQDISRIQISLLGESQVIAFLLRGQRLGKGAGV